MRISTGWTLEEKERNLNNLRDYRQKITKMAEEEIIKPNEDENVLKKLFYVQKLCRDLESDIVKRKVTTNYQYDMVINNIMLVLAVDLNE